MMSIESGCRANSTNNPPHCASSCSGRCVNIEEIQRDHGDHRTNSIDMRDQHDWKKNWPRPLNCLWVSWSKYGATMMNSVLFDRCANRLNQTPVCAPARSGRCVAVSKSSVIVATTGQKAWICEIAQWIDRQTVSSQYAKQNTIVSHWINREGCV